MSPFISNLRILLNKENTQLVGHARMPNVTHIVCVWNICRAKAPPLPTLPVSILVQLSRVHILSLVSEIRGLVIPCNIALNHV